MNADDEPYVTDVERESAPMGGTYQAGDTITASVTFSETVDVTGMPRLPLDIGGTTRHATAAPVEGATVVDFTYTVDAADYDADGFEISKNTLELDGGTIRRAGADVDADLDHPGVGANSDYTVNGVVIDEVRMVSEAPHGRFYTLDDDIEFGVTFNRSVKVTGTPQLAFCLNRSGQSCKEKKADYDRGSDSETVVFRYTVQAGDEDNNGIWIGADAVSLNGGAITQEDDSRRAAYLGHGAQGAQADHRVNAQAEIIGGGVTVTSSPRTATATYGAGERIEITVTFGAPVNATTATDFVLSVDGAKRAPLLRGSGTNQLVFGYTVEPGDEDNNGIWIGDQSRTLVGNREGDPQNGAITRVATGLAAGLTHGSLGTQSGHKVDGSLTPPNIAPVITTTSPVETPENGTAVATLAATDFESDPITWSTTGGADADRFALTTAGALTFVAAPDYESPADVASGDPANAAADNEYVVFVTASDGTDGTELELVVRVTNVDEGQSGTVSIDNTAPMIGDELTASTLDVADPDGLPDPFEPTWQWYYSVPGTGEFVITGATSATFMVGEFESGLAFIAKASWTDASGFANTLASVPTAEAVFCALNPGDLWCAGMTVDSLRLIGGGNGRGFRSGQAGTLTNSSFQYNGVPHTVQAVYYVAGASSASLPAGALALAIDPAAPDGLTLLLGGEEFSESNAMRRRDEIFWERSGVNWSFGEQVTLRLQPEAPPTVTVAAATGGDRRRDGDGGDGRGVHAVAHRGDDGSADGNGEGERDRGGVEGCERVAVVGDLRGGCGHGHAGAGDRRRRHGQRRRDGDGDAGRGPRLHDGRPGRGDGGGERQRRAGGLRAGGSGDGGRGRGHGDGHGDGDDGGERAAGDTGGGATGTRRRHGDGRQLLRGGVGDGDLSGVGLRGGDGGRAAALPGRVDP